MPHSTDFIIQLLSGYCTLSVLMSVNPCILQVWLYILQSHFGTVIQNMFVSINFTATSSQTCPSSGGDRQGTHLEEMKASVANLIPPLSSSLFLLGVLTAAKGGLLVLTSVWAAEPAQIRQLGLPVY